MVLLQNCAGLQARLKQLDEIPTRDCHSVVVLYMREGQDSVREMLKNTNLLRKSKGTLSVLCMLVSLDIVYQFQLFKYMIFWCILNSLNCDCSF